MCRVLVSLLLFSLLACSIADQTDDQNFAQLDTRYAQFDARLRGMAGANERQLLGAMGRIPDTSYQVGDQTNVLQWWWDMCTVGIEVEAPLAKAMQLVRRIVARSLGHNVSTGSHARLCVGFPPRTWEGDAVWRISRDPGRRAGPTCCG